MAIFDVLLPLLQRRFPDRGVRLEDGDDPRIIIPAQHPEVGEIRIKEHAGGAILYAGRFTHGHFDGHPRPRDSVSRAERDQNIAEDVTFFLEEMFSDRIVLWGSHERGGGWRRIDYAGMTPARGVTEYVWSGPRNI
jgi:hypothetical protein